MENLFAKDLETVTRKATSRYGVEVVEKASEVRERLLSLWEKKLIKSNHSIMEYVVSLYLISKGYDVHVEYPLGEDLVCDIYAVGGGRSLIVEIETGFVPPSNASDPISYRLAREVSKIVRYSPYADRFALATPPFHILQIPRIFLDSPTERGEKELAELKGLLDMYYREPPLSIEDLKKAKIDYVLIVNVDSVSVFQYPIESYYSMLRRNCYENLGFGGRILKTF